MIPDLTIRPEIPADCAPIRSLITAAFLKASHTSHTESLIVDALRSSGNLTLSLVAEVNGQLVGHVAISPVTLSEGNQGWYGLGPVAVAPKHQGQGIGTQLIQRALAALREFGAAGCVVLGEPQYYRRFGFQEVPNLRLPGVPPAYFQAIAFDAQLPQGVVSYHESFQVQHKAGESPLPE
ncbi:MAG: N-acetyltransferase [Synechococcales cyanobacterium C42_A2020_086]|jgi:putative acetyltransferase|nr:N-acetyltransferase [Synechococcales cyanobacterium C42_A2020_086]